MSSINIVTIGGRLGRDPELRYTGAGTALCVFSVAVEGYSKQGDNPTHWIDCKAWGKTAEFLGKHASKGARLYLVGELNQEKWQTNEGQNRSKHVVNARQISLVDWNNSDDQSSEARRPPAERQQPQDEGPMDRNGQSTEPMDDGFDDIPF